MKVFFLIFVLFICLIFVNNVEGNSHKEDLYKNLMDDYNKIFPDGNRNGGGPQFFQHIYEIINPNKRDFDLYNTFYCSVSGSPISPNRDASNLIVMKDLSNNNICGTYHRCCWPCNCDIMKYARVEKMDLKLKDGVYNYYVITIDDPCSNEGSMPKEVSCFTCCNNCKDSDKYNGKDVHIRSVNYKPYTKNGIHAPSGRLIIGILHNAKICNETQLEEIKNNELTGERCVERNSMPLEEIKYGMGDIFIKLASLNN